MYVDIYSAIAEPRRRAAIHECLSVILRSVYQHAKSRLARRQATTIQSLPRCPPARTVDIRQSLQVVSMGRQLDQLAGVLPLPLSRGNSARERRRCWQIAHKERGARAVSRATREAVRRSGEMFRCALRHAAAVHVHCVAPWVPLCGSYLSQGPRAHMQS